jgi:cytochrome c
MKRFCISVVLSLAVMCLRPGAAIAQDKTPEDLAKESEAACAASASVKATPEMVIQKVNKACELIEKEGKAAFPKFQGKDSEFIFSGTYIWINDMNGVILMHPVKSKMVGNTSLENKDASGKRMFVEFIDVAKKKGSGWVDYMWPKPGEKTASLKVSYVKKAMCDGTEVVVGCGIYDVAPDEVKKLVSQ